MKLRQFTSIGAALFGALMVTSCASHADVSVSPLFSNGVVLQRDAPIPVWGTATVGEVVTVMLDGQKQTATTDAKGKWMVSLPAHPAGQDLELTVSANNTIKISDVAVGEVWLASGQSNMELRLPRTTNAEAEMAKANYPLIRMFRVGRKIADTPQDTTKGEWEAVSPQTAENFTAVGYYFAKEIHQKLKVPVGLVHASYGGTPAEAWTSDATIQSNPKLRVINSNWQKTLADYPKAKASYDRQFASWEERAAKAKAEGKPAPNAPTSVPGPGGKATPSGLYNGMIAPVIPFGIRGVIWYQGESNTRDPKLYSELFPAMIKSWRQDWKQDFPFLFVQLANFKKEQTEPSEGGWALLRESQAMTLALPDTGMATTIDIGEAKDIHYANKAEAGRRLALVALAKQYRQDIEYYGPQYKDMAVEGGAIRVNFTHSEGMAPRGDAKVKGFAIAGADGKFVWANAKIEGQSVVVSSPLVASPVAVRYGWADNPIGNLYNAAGLPTTPFRTDPESAN